MKRFKDRSNTDKVFAKLGFLWAILLTFTFSFSSVGMADELVVNGGFEEPNLTSDVFDGNLRITTQFWSTFFGENYAGGCTVQCNYDDYGDLILVPGWSVWWTDTLLTTPVPGRLEIQNIKMVEKWPGAAANLAKFGFQKAELDSDDRGSINTNVSIEQTLATCTDYRYELTYWWKSRRAIPGDNDTRVLVGDTKVRVNMLNDNWAKETILFVADDYDTELAFASIGNGQTWGMYLDEVSVKGRLGGSPEACACGPDDYADDDSSDDNGSEGSVDDDSSSTDGSATCWAVDDGSSDDDAQTYNHMYTDMRAEICSLGEDLKSLTFLYDGNNYTDYTQNPAGVTIDPLVYPNPTPPPFPWPETAHFKVMNGPTLLAAGSLKIGELLKVQYLGDVTTVILTDAGNNTLQTIDFDTSCYEPLHELDEFGGVTIWSGETY